MKYKLLVLIAFTNIFQIFSQINKCDCIVKLNDYQLKIQQSMKVKIDDGYYKLRPKNEKKCSFNKLVKDSASFWFFIPISSDTALNKTIKVKKMANVILINIPFNNLDSIPIYSEPIKDAKIIKYLYKDKRTLTATDKTIGYELNDQYFSTCKNGWVKITGSSSKNTNDKYSATGWIKKEHYLKK